MENYAETRFWKSLVHQVRAIDQWGTWDSWTDERIITQKYIRTREEMAEVPLTADVDERILTNIRLMFQGLAQAIEQELGIMTSTVIDINQEGFGRALVITQNIILYEKVYREAHRFHFSSIEKMVEQGEKMRAEGIKTYGLLKDCLDRS